MPLLQGAPAIRSTELAMYRAQALVGAHGVLQFNRDSDSMELWGWWVVNDPH
jgi:hypothetical protein